MPNPKFGATGDGANEETGFETDDGTGDGTGTTGPTTDTNTSTTTDTNTDTGSSTTDPNDCGNGMVDPGETCDADAIPNGSCDACQVTCHDGFENCNQKPDDGCEVDLLSAAASCGYCGHDCQGGTCKDGACQPLRLGEAQQGPYDLAVGDKYAYWTNRTGGSVVYVDKTGGGKVTQIAEGQNGPTGIVLRGGLVYWTNNYAGEVVRAQLGNPPTTFAKGQYGPFMMAADDSTIYWTNFDGGTVQAQPINGMAWTSIAVQQGSPRYIDATATMVLWDANLTEGSVLGLVKGDNQYTGLATGQGLEMGGLAADTDWVYFAVPNPGLVAKVPAGGGEVTVVADGQPKPKEVVFDGEHVYWTNSDSGEVVARVRAGGDPWVLGTSPGTPWAIAQDDGAVYWTDLTDGSVWKVAKP